MKNVSGFRLFKSLVLMFLVSTLVSFAVTGDPAAIAGYIGAGLFVVGMVQGFVKFSLQVPGALMEALVINDTTYSGTVASYMIAHAVVGADTVEKSCIYVEDGIRKQKTIPRIEVSGFMQKRAATPTSTGAVTVDGKVLVPQDAMLYYEFNPRDFESHFYAEQLSPKLLGRELPVTAENFMMMQTMKRLNEFFENMIWRGRLAYQSALDPTTKGAAAGDSVYQYFDGLIKKALNDSNTLKVASPVALTSANIIAQFGAAYNLVPKALLFKYGAAGLRFFVSYPDQQKYEDALANSTYKNQDTTEKGINRYKGYDVVALAGLPENTFFVGYGKPDIDSNLWLGMNSLEDNNLQLQRLQNNSELFFVKGLFKMDVQIGFAEQLVMYTTQIN